MHVEMVSKEEIMGTTRHSFGLRREHQRAGNSNAVDVFIAGGESPLRVSEYYTSVTRTQKAIRGPGLCAKGAGAWEP